MKAFVSFPEKFNISYHMKKAIIRFGDIYIGLDQAGYSFRETDFFDPTNFYGKNNIKALLEPSDPYFQDEAKAILNEREYIKSVFKRADLDGNLNLEQVKEVIKESENISRRRSYYRLPHKNFEELYGFKSNSKKAKKAKFNALALLIALEYEDKTS